MRENVLFAWATDSVKIAYNGTSGKIEYVGFSAPGTETSTAGWKIKKITYDGTTGKLTDVQWAGGSPSYSFAWDSRASYSFA